LRLKPEQRLSVVTPSFQALTKVEDAGQHSEGFLAEMKKFHPSLTHCEVPVRPNSEEIRLALHSCESADAIIVLTYNLHLNPPQRECAQALVNLGKPAMVAAVRDPHDLAFITGANAYIATYSFRECSLKALAEIIFGKRRAEGKLPVKLQ
jgi:beta-N-acetylhexosaminidase